MKYYGEIPLNGGVECSLGLGMKNRDSEFYEYIALNIFIHHEW